VFRASRCLGSSVTTPLALPGLLIGSVYRLAGNEAPAGARIRRLPGNGRSPGRAAAMGPEPARANHLHSGAWTGSRVVIPSSSSPSSGRASSSQGSS
jgi:hypothetical protein